MKTYRLCLIYFIELNILTMNNFLQFMARTIKGIKIFLFLFRLNLNRLISAPPNQSFPKKLIATLNLE
jgi:hypothetical protein